MLLRSRGKAGVRAEMFKTGNSLKGGASAWIVGWVRVFCCVFARRSVTQKEAAVDGQVWAAVLFAGRCIAWQWVMAPGLLTG
jgi:beta-lactamase class D